MSRQVYAPNREKIFEDIQVDDVCDAMSCGSMQRPQQNPKLEPVCMATDHQACVRVNQVACEINQFIADNDDVFVYVKLVSE